MSHAENTPEYWRAKADEMRAFAASATDPQAKSHLHAAAEAYMRLCMLAERQPLIARLPDHTP